MNPRISVDEMVVIWEAGDRDAAHALVQREGFEIARISTGLVDTFRRADGSLERRIVYASEQRTKARHRDRARRNAKEDACEG
jgi:hypothetical protein